MLFESADARMKAHERWMREALRAARNAQALDEVPIGAAIVIGEEMVAVSGNRTRTECDPTVHAEIIALREAAKRIGNYRLPEAIVYSKIEPCAMCAAALIQARVALLASVSPEPRAG